jgi:hypothetical protein
MSACIKCNRYCDVDDPDYVCPECAAEQERIYEAFMAAKIAMDERVRIAKLEKSAACSHAEHFSDPLQAAEQDLLGEALQSCSDANQVVRNILDDVWLRARLHEFPSAEALVVAAEARLCALLAKTKGNE